MSTIVSIYVQVGKKEGVGEVRYVYTKKEPGSANATGQAMQRLVATYRPVLDVCQRFGTTTTEMNGRG